MEAEGKIETQPKLQEILSEMPKRIGVAADHGGFHMKQELVSILRKEGYDVTDFGNNEPKPDDDYPDYVVPLAHAVARGKVERGIAICGSGVGACVIANKIRGIRACLINDPYSARQGVEDDNMNIICLGGRVVGNMLAYELVNIFLTSRYSGAERHRRRLAKIAKIETEAKGSATDSLN